MKSSLHPRLSAWWKDDPRDPGRMSLDHLDLQRLVADIAPGSRITDLGGTMSLNARLEPARLVLRVYQAFVSRRRLFAVQEVRRCLAGSGLIVPIPFPWRGATVFRCGSRWAELEQYIPHRRPPPSPDSYGLLFGAMGDLHRALGVLAVKVPRPVVSTYAPPGSLRRWLPRTELAVRADPQAARVARTTRDLVNRLRTQWVPAARLPMQLGHGDVRLGNLCRTPEDQTVYLDFGFLAHRSRVHDIAYALAFMVLALGQSESPAAFDWGSIPPLVREYEESAHQRLTQLEMRALSVYAAAVPLYFAALAGFSADPVAMLRARAPFLRLSDWLLAHPDAMLGE